MRKIISTLTRAWRALVDAPAVRHLIQTQRAALVLAPAGPFIANQALYGKAASYRLRGTGEPVYVRHRTRDIDILAEVFTAGSYEPPPGIGTTLDGPLRIVDVGGNVGLFGLDALRRWDVAHLVSYEPDPANYRLLRPTAAHHDQWEVVKSAVSDQEGSMRFVTGLYSESRAAADGEDAIDVPVVDLFADPLRVDLLKLDIEGGEWPILADPRLADFSARVVVMEWHERGCPVPDARRHASELLAAAGFVHQHDEPGSDSNGLLWAWR